MKARREKEKTVLLQSTTGLPKRSCACAEGRAVVNDVKRMKRMKKRKEEKVVPFVVHAVKSSHRVLFGFFNGRYHWIYSCC